MNECFRRCFPPGSWEQSESVAISAAVEEKGGSLPGLTAGRGPLLGLWPRPLLLTQGADSKPSVYGSSECGGSPMWGPLYHFCRSRLDRKEDLVHACHVQPTLIWCILQQAEWNVMKCKYSGVILVCYSLLTLPLYNSSGRGTFILSPLASQIVWF